jgi:3',5'-cyclic-AMP phosphodiesterase
MPFHLAPASRRAFIAQLGGALIFVPALRAQSGSRMDSDRIAILNDTHIGGEHPVNAPIPTHLREAVAWLVAQERHPSAVIINGDLALNDGQLADYEHFAKLIAPLHEARIPVHLSLGNHDNREAFYEMLKSQKPAELPLVSKHMSVIRLPKANLFLLDSLKGTNIAQGLLGREQLAWLGRMLDAHPNKPALVFAHHNPRIGEKKYFTGGLEDSEPLWDMLVPRTQVKAYVHGHIHRRNYSQHRGIHIIDTPATSFVLNSEESTTGWTMAQLSDQGGEFTTLTHTKAHAWNGASKKLTWRSA